VLSQRVDAAWYDRASIRIEERQHANRTTINGVSLQSMEKMLTMGRQRVARRTMLTGDATRTAMAAAQ
jgi:hypothetical protein